MDFDMGYFDMWHNSDCYYKTEMGGNVKLLREMFCNFESLCHMSHIELLIFQKSWGLITR